MSNGYKCSNMTRYHCKN